ncbi:MAG TPA: cysteine desulfurase [Bacteroidales bacterium]|nr:cysteine desulfurase [Bacteroidales bacterium]HRS18095.1 cysteine desulfurase [Bacteroidales bacterium]
MYNIQSIRNDFPILHQKIHNHDFIYFDSAATTQKPQQVIDAIVQSYSKTNSNIHRGIHTLSQVSTDLYEQARKKVQNFIHAPKAEEIIFTKGVTESINLVAYSFGETFVKPGDEIIISAMEHHSNLVPWQMVCERKQAVLKFIPFNVDGILDLEWLQQSISEKTKLVSIVHVSNSLGTINPIKQIIDIAHSYNVPVCVDGAQSIQHTPINVQELDCDFFAFSGHKMYAPTGIGVLWGKESWLEQMLPYQGGGDMIETVTLEKTIYNSLPFKFEAGTSNYVGAHALGVAIDYIEKIGIASIQHHEQSLLMHATNKLQTIEGLTIIGNAPHKAGAISFTVQGAHPADVGLILDKKGIAIRTGTHCTEPIMQFYGIPGTARISFGMYNTIEEIDICCDILQKVTRMFL